MMAATARDLLFTNNDYQLLFIGQSAESQAVLEQARRAATRHEPVLITGETGTGKETIARIVHGGRGPFVPIDCTQLTHGLASRELYGNERGAYTGADQRRPGMLHEAEGGTAFFDELGTLSLEVQATLLRVLQEKHFRPVGSTVYRRADFRIIAATNLNLKEQVQLGNFREDLYYRLDVIRIQIPPLRARPVDVRILIEHFAKEFHIEISPEAMEALAAYPWPGNVRQLMNNLNRAAVQTHAPIIGLNDLPSTIIDHWLSAKKVASFSPKSINPNSELCFAPKSLSEVEMATIVGSLIANKGNRTKVLAELRLSRSTLGRRLKQMRNDPRFGKVLSVLGA
jgi:DNA-binding NtrC family response regulator